MSSRIEKIFSNCLWVQFPESFTEMPDDKRTLHFPYPITPQIIMLDNTSKIIVTLSMLDESLENQNVMKAIKSMVRVLGLRYPDCMIQRSKIENQDVVIGWFSYKTNSVKGHDNYHITFILPVDGRFVLGGLHGPISLRNDIFKVFKDISESIEIHKKERVLQWWEGVNPI